MLWAVGRYDLQLSTEEFWGLVPRQFVALLRRQRLERIGREYGPALITSAILARGAKRPPDPTTFMPSYNRKKDTQEIPWQVMKSRMRAAGRALGGS